MRVNIMARPRRQVKYTEIEIDQLIKFSDNALYNALAALYQCQLDDEQVREVSIHHNRHGFAKPDAKSMTVLAKLLQENGSLEFGNKQVVRNKLVSRYVRQITKIANENWDQMGVTLV